MTLQEIQYKAQGIIHKWRDDDSAPYIEFVEELAHMIVPEPSEDLEEAANEYARYHYADTFSQELAENDFIAGSAWKEMRMLKDAVEGEVDFEYFGYKVIRPDLKQLDTLLESMNHGDKVRIIIVKEEE